MQRADADYGDKIEKLKGLHSREIKLLKGETDEKQKILSDMQKQNAKYEKQIEVQQKEVRLKGTVSSAKLSRQTSEP